MEFTIDQGNLQRQIVEIFAEKIRQWLQEIALMI
jgi:hypothetical protein